MWCGPFVHAIDPIMLSAGGVHLWWYGASYTLGFIGVLAWMKRDRLRLQYGRDDAYALAIFLAAGVLLGGRAVEVIFYEWDYYGQHPRHLFAVWLGGMSTHGILLGATVAVFLFCKVRRKSFLPLADSLAIVGAYIMGVGRIGNFIDGQIGGAVGEVCWAVQFPDSEGFRHPVVLYDGAKNLLLVPFLLYLQKRISWRGFILGNFIFWYGFLRIFVDLFREYRGELAGFPPGQEFNVLMSIIGAAVIFWSWRKKQLPPLVCKTDFVDAPARWRQKIAFLLLAAFPLIIPSDWTQDVPHRYGKRHPGLEYSALYPPIEERR